MSSILNKTLTVALFVWLVSLSTGVAQADDIETSILQLKLDRVYFPVGEESHVYRYSPFAVIRDSLEIFHGYLDFSWSGISASRPTDGFFDTLDLATLRVELTPADTVSPGVVSLGTDLAEPELPIVNQLRPEVEITRYEDTDLLLDAWRAGMIGCLVTFGGSPAESEPQRQVAPYVAALVPNAGRSCNYQGQLTTSLYYRFDESRIGLMTTGEPELLTRFQSHPAARDLPWPTRPGGRAYPYDPERGRALFQNLTHPPPALKVYAATPSLRRVAYYYADLLSRDRCPVEMTDNRTAADLYVEYVPVSAALPSLIVSTLLHRLDRDAPPGSPADEQVSQMQLLLDRLGTAQTEAEYYRGLDRIERELIEELGVFPLFAPRLRLYCRPGLRGARFDATGQLDFSAVYEVLLPRPPENEAQP